MRNKVQWKNEAVERRTIHTRATIYKVHGVVIAIVVVVAIVMVVAIAIVIAIAIEQRKRIYLFSTVPC